LHLPTHPLTCISIKPRKLVGCVWASIALVCVGVGGGVATIRLLMGGGRASLMLQGSANRMQLIEIFSSQLTPRDSTVRKLEITEIVSACALN